MPGVQTTVSLPNAVRQITAGAYEGSPKWLTLSRNQDTLNYAAQQAWVNNPDLFNTDCSVMPVIAYLKDHKAETLTQVVRRLKFAKANTMRPASSCWRPATRASRRPPTLWSKSQPHHVALRVSGGDRPVFHDLSQLARGGGGRGAAGHHVDSGRSADGGLGMGVKVATLPVIALGVGIGVDYSLYLLSVQLAEQRRGLSLAAAHKKSLQFTGKVVGLVGITLAAGVVTWAWSPIKFQADMGILLTFMFIWNMVGALVLIPALSHFLMNDRHFAAARKAS